MVKKSSDILGLPVLSIAEATSHGRVQGLVINPDERAVDFFVVEPEVWYKEARLVATGDVMSIGDDALTVESKARIVPVGANTAALELLQKDVRALGTKLLTKTGKFVGSVSEIGIDTATGKIVGYEWIPNGQDAPAGVIPAAAIVTLGKDLIVVVNEFQDRVLPSFETAVQEPAPHAPAPDPGSTVPAAGADPLEVFEAKQKQYLLGRKIQARIVADDGQVIAEEGQTVTQEIIDRAVAADKYVELALNTGE
ncbi:MAG: PRC-barrel domain-containing protein [Desulfotomaculales bacterium]